QLALGDDAAHALLIGRRIQRSETVLFELEADRVPVEIRRADGEPFGEVESAVRVSGRWFVASPSGPAGTHNVIWQSEGGVARELTRVPRALPAGNGDPRLRFSRATDRMRMT